MKYQCPICEEYPGPTPGSIRGHISGKSDDAHRGKSGIQFTDSELEKDNDVEDSNTEIMPDDNDDPVNDDVNPVEVPDSEPECPECGGEDYFVPEEALEELGENPDDWPEVSKHDYGCPRCTTQASWQVWSDD